MPGDVDYRAYVDSCSVLLHFTEVCGALYIVAQLSFESESLLVRIETNYLHRRDLFKMKAEAMIGLLKNLVTGTTFLCIA